MRRKYGIALVVLVLLAGLGYVGRLKYVDHVEAQKALRAQQAAEEARKKQAKEIDDERRAVEAYRQRMIQAAIAPGPLSPWLEDDKKFLLSLLDRAQPKVVVVPPVIPQDAKGIDISGRVTIARQIVAAMGVDGGGAPDPAFVYRALGEVRSISLDELRQKLAMTNAEWLVIGSAQHDGKGKMHVTLSKVPLRKPQGNDPAPAFDRDGIEIGGERTPELQFAPLAADAVRALGFTPVAPADAVLKNSALAMPGSPLDASKAEDSVAGLWMQQLMGSLHMAYPVADPRPRERMFERVLAAVMAMPNQAPDRATLLARSLVNLDRREAAVAVLAGASGTPEEKALDAYLRADIPGLTAAIGQVKRPVARLISELELLQLQSQAGGLTQDAVRAVVQRLGKSVPPGWQPLVAYHVLSFDFWNLPSPDTVKLILDRDLPVPGFSMQEIARGGAAVSGGMSEKAAVELLLSPFPHARKWREANARELCCGSGAAAWSRVQPSQYLDLLADDAERLAVGKLQFLSQIQGAPDQALRLADLYDQAMFGGGLPSVVQQRLNILAAQARTADPSNRSRLALESFELSRKLLTWQTSQGLPAQVALQARNNFYGDFVQSREASRYGPQVLPQHPLELDRPARWDWSRYIGRVTTQTGTPFLLEASKDACVSTVASCDACTDYVALLKDLNRPAEIPAAIKSLIEPRFNGYPKRTGLVVAALKEGGNIDAAKDLLRQAVRSPNAPMEAYENLGDFLREAGEFSAAAQAFLSYPGLKGRGENVVAISNYTGKAARSLAYRGGVREARPLLERASANRDGSNDSLSSTARLAMLDGDYGRALKTLRQSYQRYGQGEAARQIISLLFLVGEPDPAWSALRGILPRAPDSVPYRAVPVGMRIGGFDNDAMLRWRQDAYQQVNSAGRPREPDLFDMALLQTILLDHQSIDQLDSMFEAAGGPYVFPKQPKPAPGAPAANGPITKTALSPSAGQMMKGYVAFTKGDHAAAVAAWNELVTGFDVNAYPAMFADTEGSSFWSVMPYFAFSLVKTGRAAEAKALPTRLTKEGRPSGARKIPDGMAQVPMPEFDRRMIEGITEALAGNHDKAVVVLRHAQGVLANQATRILPPDYVLAEILEQLSRETKEPRYLSMALEFARAFRQYEPWTAWAYAFEASNTPAGPEQTRLAALALRLNPRSLRMSKLDANVQRAARDIANKGNPFRVEPPAAKQRS